MRQPPGKVSLGMQACFSSRPKDDRFPAGELGLDSCCQPLTPAQRHRTPLLESRSIDGDGDGATAQILELVEERSRLLRRAIEAEAEQDCLSAQLEAKRESQARMLREHQAEKEKLREHIQTLEKKLQIKRQSPLVRFATSDAEVEELQEQLSQCQSERDAYARRLGEMQAGLSRAKACVTRVGSHSPSVPTLVRSNTMPEGHSDLSDLREKVDRTVDAAKKLRLGGELGLRRSKTLQQELLESRDVCEAAERERDGALREVQELRQTAAARRQDHDGGVLEHIKQRRVHDKLEQTVKQLQEELTSVTEDASATTTAFKEGVARIHTQLEVVRRHLLEAEDKLEEASGDWTPWVHIRTVKQDCADMRLKVTDLAGQAKAIIELQRHRTQVLAPRVRVPRTEEESERSSQSTSEFVSKYLDPSLWTTPSPEITGLESPVRSR